MPARLEDSPQNGLPLDLAHLGVPMSDEVAGLVGLVEALGLDCGHWLLLPIDGKNVPPLRGMVQVRFRPPFPWVLFSLHSPAHQAETPRGALNAIGSRGGDPARRPG